MSSSEDDQRPTRPYLPGQEEAVVPPHSGEELAAPARLGRYVLLGFIGAGGMGVVYTAYDPQLDRKVALKLLRPLPPGPAQEEQQGRLLREARAMARLSHPHVVHVHDAGEVGSQVYLAMELVEGQDLRRWMRESPRAWEEIRGLLFQAGQGLAAAHRAGLVHRDFKPENVLIGGDGRARVTDFGLAAPALPSGSTEPSAGPVPVVGTPEYLAPEQLWGAASDPRADQFSFCVTLYEALYGELPFAGDNPAQRATAATLGQLRRAPDGSPVPAWLRALLARGLSAEPASRFPSMEALLAALQPPPTDRRRRWLRVAVTVAVTSFAFVTLWNWNQQRLLQSCDGGEARLLMVWDGPTRQRLESAFLASGTPGAAELSLRVQAALDRYAQGWLAIRREVCVATRVRRVTPLPVMEARLQCLEGRAAGLGALTRLLSAADGPLVLRAPQAVDALESVAACATAVPPPATAAPPPPQLLQRLVEARARFKANQVDQALEESRSLREAADGAGAPGLVAEAALLECEALTVREEPAPAVEGCLGAALRAEEARLPVQAAFAWTNLVEITTNEGEHDRARLWLKIAHSMVARLEGRSEEAAARLANAEGFAAFGAGDYARAEEAWGRNLAIRERALPEQAWDRAAALTNLGVARLRQGQPSQALEALERGLLLHRQVLGDDHPELATIMATIAMAKMNLGQVQPARALLQESISLRRRFGGAEANVSLELGNLGWLDLERGDYAQSLAHFEEAQRLREQSLGPNHPFVAASLLGRAEALVGLGRISQAVPLAQRALAMREAKYGVQHPLTADAYRELGLVLVAAGQRRAGMASLRRGLAVSEQVRAADQLETAVTLLAAAEGALALDDSREARILAQRAGTLLTGRPIRPIHLARLHSLMARCHLAQGEREAARSEAQRADGLFRSFALPTHPEWAQVRSLLDSLAPPSASP